MPYELQPRNTSKAALDQFRRDYSEFVTSVQQSRESYGSTARGPFTARQIVQLLRQEVLSASQTALGGGITVENSTAEGSMPWTEYKRTVQDVARRALVALESLEAEGDAAQVYTNMRDAVNSVLSASNAHMSTIEQAGSDFKRLAEPLLYTEHPHNISLAARLLARGTGLERARETFSNL
jgi:hypothetical protein